MVDVRNVIIIGSGPAGYTAGIYTSRAELKPLLFAGEKAGGQLMLTTEVENWPGNKEGIMGPELMVEMREQAKKFGTEIVDKNVTWVDFESRPFKVGIGDPSTAQNITSSGRAQDDKPDSESLLGLSSGGGQVFEAKSVIIATGAEAMLLGVPGESELMGRGVSTCAVCDAAFYRDKVTYVVGGGDAAAEEVLALTKFAKSVTLLVRRDALRASRIMAKRVTENPKVTVKWNTELKEVRGEGKVEKLLIVNNQTNQEEEVATDGVFIAIGHRPMTDLFKGKVELDPKGFLLTGVNGLLNKRAATLKTQKEAENTEGSDGGADESLWLKGYPTMTSADGVFGAGDVVDFRYKQAVTSAGMGCMAALDAEKWLESH